MHLLHHLLYFFNKQSVIIKHKKKPVKLVRLRWREINNSSKIKAKQMIHFCIKSTYVTIHHD